MNIMRAFVCRARRTRGIRRADGPPRLRKGATKTELKCCFPHSEQAFLKNRPPFSGAVSIVRSHLGVYASLALRVIVSPFARKVSSPCVYPVNPVWLEPPVTVSRKAYCVDS